MCIFLLGCEVRSLINETMETESCRYKQCNWGGENVTCKLRVKFGAKFTF
jgi:hypothetical protein